MYSQFSNGVDIGNGMFVKKILPRKIAMAKMKEIMESIRRFGVSTPSSRIKWLQTRLVGKFKEECVSTQALKIESGAGL